MKYILTIESTDPNEIIRLMSGNVNAGATVYSSGASGTVGGAQMTGNDDGEDDGSAGPANVAPGALDKGGLPWDGRIHSDAKTQTQEGVWRRRKGVKVTDPLYIQVLNELRAANPPQTIPYQPPANMVIPGQNPGNGAPAPGGYQQPYQPPANVVIQPTQQNPGGMAFGEFMPHYAQAISTGKTTEAEVLNMLYQLGVPQGAPIMVLANDPVRTAQLYNWCVSAGKI